MTFSTNRERHGWNGFKVSFGHINKRRIKVIVCKLLHVEHALYVKECKLYVIDNRGGSTRCPDDARMLAKMIFPIALYFLYI